MPEITMDTTQLVGLQEKLKEYRRVSRKSNEAVTAKTAKELTWNLYKGTAAAAHTRDYFLTELPNERNWRIADLRRGVKVDGPRGRDHVMQILKQRASHRKYSAVGFLRLAKVLPDDRLNPVQQLTGELRVSRSTDGGSITATVINKAVGIDKWLPGKGIINDAIARTEANMQQYIDRKYEEATTIFNV
jgi:hypothetical protein